MNRKQATHKHQHNRVRHHAGKTNSYDYFNLLTSSEMFETVESVLPEHRERTFPPTETLSMFLAQAMSVDRSCQAIVDDAAVKRLLGGLPVCSTYTGGYCKARQRLPLTMVSTLTRYSGRLVSERSLSHWHWRGRPVRLVDGATVALPDTPDNQIHYPQPTTQQPGLGFPQCRLVGMICLGSGALLDMAMGPCQGKGSDEQSLLRTLLDTLNSGDILLGDAFYATYFLICELYRRGIDGVFEQQGARKRSTDFRKGKHLGPRDHLIELKKPKIKPDWMTQADYHQAPDSLTVRELQTGGKILVTTLTCAKQVSKADLKTLYRDRWHVELDLRNIKTTLGMETLSCRTPQMAQVEIWVYLLAYNLIRLMIAQAALLADVLPRQISFKHTVQIWLAWRHMGHGSYSDEQLMGLFILIAQQRVGNRPGRIEPRAVKRRPKPFPLLTKPRHFARDEIRKYGYPKKLK